MVMKSILIAPCGMNCTICIAYLRERRKCPGCRMENESKSLSCINCRIKNCTELKKCGSGFCYSCGEYPCARLKHLDKRYRTKYSMSMIENLDFVKKHGIRKFLKSQERKYKCRKCGGVICVHIGKCYKCDKIESWRR
jgi:hypothetical protein